jgi:hypothetical protein
MIHLDEWSNYQKASVGHHDFDSETRSSPLLGIQGEWVFSTEKAECGMIDPG